MRNTKVIKSKDGSHIYCTQISWVKDPIYLCVVLPMPLQGLNLEALEAAAKSLRYGGIKIVYVYSHAEKISHANYTLASNEKNETLLKKITKSCPAVAISSIMPHKASFETLKGVLRAMNIPMGTLDLPIKLKDIPLNTN